jgi:hypothetical protein
MIEVCFIFCGVCEDGKKIEKCKVYQCARVENRIFHD